MYTLPDQSNSVNELLVYFVLSFLLRPNLFEMLGPSILKELCLGVFVVVLLSLALGGGLVDQFLLRGKGNSSFFVGLNLSLQVADVSEAFVLLILFLHELLHLS